MYSQPNSSQSRISQVVERIAHSGKITRLDEDCFRQVMTADDPLSYEEQMQVRAIYDRLQMGLLRVVD